jgi:hypothetical protein
MSSESWKSLGPLLDQARKDAPVQPWERTVSGVGLPTCGDEPKPRRPLSEARKVRIREYSRAYRERKHQESEQ